ncbi:MAG: SAM-dependent methyltransferase [Phormidesmis priestleyi]|uniref:SAM-dependent methyltransferase n=1 Tax=Phormidesmis priestleyi TaxID=268141 RepID=A0A2W4X6Y9_9CYAN|nr:MAG: SAM-dependent methyltransferase [Phormidesmis priestleyi]
MTATIAQKIQQFYDESSPLWERTWGEHMHHGYYGSTGQHKKNRRQAQIDLIEEALKWANVRSADTILDVGCGIGGSTLYLAEKFSAKAVGITLSPVQAQRAGERAIEKEIALTAWENFADVDAPAVQFQVTDALATPFPDNAFDFIWSMESGEHMPDKQSFLRECYRLLKPGGTFLMATWCHRSTDNLAGALTTSEKQHLDWLYQLYHLPYVISLPAYAELATQVGFTDLTTADWSAQVEFFWQDVVQSALNLEAIAGILQSGTETMRGTAAIALMTTGFRRGLIRYGLLSGSKA